MNTMEKQGKQPNEEGAEHTQAAKHKDPTL